MEITLTIRLIDSSNCTLKINPKETLLNLKEKIFTEYGIDIYHQKIIYGGRVLTAESKTLYDLNIKENSNLHLIVALRGG